MVRIRKRVVSASASYTAVLRDILFMGVLIIFMVLGFTLFPAYTDTDTGEYVSNIFPRMVFAGFGLFAMIGGTAVLKVMTENMLGKYGVRFDGLRLVFGSHSMNLTEPVNFYGPYKVGGTSYELHEKRTVKGKEAIERVIQTRYEVWIAEFPNLIGDKYLEKTYELYPTRTFLVILPTSPGDTFKEEDNKKYAYGDDIVVTRASWGTLEWAFARGDKEGETRPIMVCTRSPFHARIRQMVHQYTDIDDSFILKIPDYIDRTEILVLRQQVEQERAEKIAYMQEEQDLDKRARGMVAGIASRFRDIRQGKPWYAGVGGSRALRTLTILLAVAGLCYFAGYWVFGWWDIPFLPPRAPIPYNATSTPNV